MIWNIAIPIYLIVFSTCAVLYFLIKSRLKELYPDLHARLFAQSIIEHNIKRSLEFQRFALSSAQWSEINDEKLLSWLKINRISFVIMVSMLAMVFLMALVGLIYYAATGQK